MMRGLSAARRVKLRTDTDLLLPGGALILTAVVFVILAQAAGRPIAWANGYDIMTNFAELGLISLGISLGMMAGEFDLSLPSMYYFAGAIAILTGGKNPLLGVALATGTGIVVGAMQGTIIAKLRVSSVPVTLGGYIILLGLFYVVSGNKSLAYSNFTESANLDQAIGSIFTQYSLIVLVIFILVALAMRFTRFGVAVRAIGGDRRASRVSGIAVDRTLILIFAGSAGGVALSGALLGYSTAGTTPNADLSPLIFAVTAAVLGGVRLEGGRGTVLGVGVAVIALSLLQEGLVVTNVSQQVSETITGVLLAIVALISATNIRRSRRGSPTALTRLVGMGRIGAGDGRIGAGNG
jgi:ribose transport system permease protein